MEKEENKNQQIECSQCGIYRIQLLAVEPDEKDKHTDLRLLCLGCGHLDVIRIGGTPEYEKPSVKKDQTYMN